MEHEKEKVQFQALFTDRLRLLALPRAALALLHTSLRAFEQDTGFKVTQDLLTDATRRAIARKLSRMQAEPEALHAWHTYWLAVPKRGEPPQGIGLLGYKGPPDTRGEVEIAYSIDPSFQSLGYATEAARALIAWAFDQPGCLAVIAPDTPRANAASNRVLEKLGMRVYEAKQSSQSWRVERVC